MMAESGAPDMPPVTPSRVTRDGRALDGPGEVAATPGSTPAWGPCAHRVSDSVCPGLCPCSTVTAGPCGWKWVTAPHAPTSRGCGGGGCQAHSAHVRKTLPLIVNVARTADTDARTTSPRPLMAQAANRCSLLAGCPGGVPPGPAQHPHARAGLSPHAHYPALRRARDGAAPPGRCWGKAPGAATALGLSRHWHPAELPCCGADRLPAGR